MEITINSRPEVDIVSKIQTIIDVFKVSRLETLMSDFFDNLSEDNPINYVGELNKNDIMH